MRKAFLLAAGVLAVMTAPSSQSQSCVDTALVLAVDGSGSITDEEYEFQKAAIVSAFRDGSVLSAIRSSGSVAVAAVFWGDGELSSQKIGWFVMDGITPSEQFALEVERNQRTAWGNTDIGGGLWVALDLLSDPKLCARRLIVDISGDGRETIAPKRRKSISLNQARGRAEEMGVTINGLVISDEEADLADYYDKSVIMGPNKFVMDIRKFEDFARAIRLKLIRELS
ncbi:DUF1194 domain-containing protein [Phyllobacterium sp. LjRoot231]|uniref:DUF1194 domain-containing protein n=1 Tax=Phyllobacterium sp. LjRoot231 TaxID=3342289 RepID=UPI003ED120DB